MFENVPYRRAAVLGKGWILAVLWRVSLVFTPCSVGVHARLKGAEPPLAFFVFSPLKGLFWDAIEVMALVTSGRSVTGCYEVFLKC